MPVSERRRGHCVHRVQRVVFTNEDCARSASVRRTTRERTNRGRVGRRSRRGTNACPGGEMDLMSSFVALTLMSNLAVAQAQVVPTLSPEASAFVAAGIARIGVSPGS